MRRRPIRTAATVASSVLALGLLAACGSEDSGTTAESGGSGGGGGESKSLTIGYIPWDEDIAVTYLWQHVLEEEGYDVKIQQLDVAPTFAGLAQGDLELFFDTWLPVTHEDYWAQYGEKIEDLGVWYDQATLNIAVPEYVDAESIADLQGMADKFGGTITGIEAGAGLTRVTEEEAMPAYGLDEYKLQTSSTTAMLAELSRAIEAKEPIVVTLWHPHWAYSAFPIKDLEDPKGAMGDAEEIHVVGREGFTKDFPELAAALGEFTMDDDRLGSLENVVLREYQDDPAAGVDAWVAENQAWVDGLME
ncbi:MAG TPA: glycine betaine ABC transporter substrate-binding protein [Nocardioidaceae bacterium]|nr:glycine betaine ABC transporter substrate-binding protein [Nocardioidaceae bacterium]